jgi:hypothetical protein
MTSEVGTPLALLRDADGGPPRMGHRMYRLGKDGSRTPQTQDLSLHARLWHSLRHPRTGPPGSECRVSLNLLFAEWLMGLPLGWTDLGQSATASFRTWLRSRGGR